MFNVEDDHVCCQRYNRRDNGKVRKTERICSTPQSLRGLAGLQKYPLKLAHRAKRERQVKDANICE